MNRPPEDIRQWIQDLITRSASDQIESQKRFEELLRRTTRGELNQAELREEYMRFAQQEGLRYIRDLTRVGLSFYNTLLELNRQYNDRFYDHVFHQEPNGNGAKMAQAAPAPVRLVDMEFHGQAGNDVSRSFAIENQQPEPVSVGFLISDFTNPDGTASFRPPVQFSPARFTLRPGEERMVTVVIPLLPEFFTPGQSYAATAIVSGFEQLQLRLKVSVDAQPVEKSVPERRSPVFLPVEEPPAPPLEVQDDLARIKGIGPSYLNKLYQAGVKSFASLAGCDPETLQRVLGSSAAQRAQRLQWQEQARLAARQDWTALAAFQATLS